MRWLAYVLLITLLLASAGWSALALWYEAATAVWARALWAGAWVVLAFAVLALSLLRREWWPALVYLGLLAVLLLWWSSIRPSNQRDWADDVARQLQGQVQGDLVTLHNVRDFNWRSDTDYDVHWEDRRYNLQQLQSADLALSTWGVPGIAHALISFGFADGSHVIFSVEIRRVRGQSFSSLGGFFKQFEQTVVAADERDVLRVRTNVRGETMHLYRLHMSAAQMRDLFLAYVGEANTLIDHPAYYNTLTANCVTIVYGMAKRIVPGLPYDYRLLLTAYLPGYLYEVGALDRSVPLAELEREGAITARARASSAEDFSRAIRTPPER